MLFTDFKNSKLFMRYSRSKSETTTGSLWEAQTKTANILKSLKIYGLIARDVHFGCSKISNA